MLLATFDSAIRTVFDNWIVAIVLICAFYGIVSEIAKQIRKYGCYRQEVALKRDMVERGLSVDEIERIVAAKGRPTSRESDPGASRIELDVQGR